MTQPPPQSEQERIRAVYRAWHGGSALPEYAWHRPEVLQQVAARARTVGTLLAATLGPDLRHARVLDVGCGSGAFLRQLIGWGADPANLAGTEYQDERLDYARARSAPGVRWHLGDLDFAAPCSFDLVSANTVFSSILDESARTALAQEMWRVLKPGGWCLVFDFRYNNPANPNVRKVTRAELQSWWPGSAWHYRTLLLAPPVSRRLARAPRLAAELLEALVPPLRSHFVWMARKQ
ncbi:MAG: class I SAM-dependent methyltransferase [Telluria sp.]